MWQNRVRWQIKATVWHEIYMATLTAWEETLNLSRKFGFVAGARPGNTGAITRHLYVISRIVTHAAGSRRAWWRCWSRCCCRWCGRGRASSPWWTACSPGSGKWLAQPGKSRVYMYSIKENWILQFTSMSLKYAKNCDICWNYCCFEVTQQQNICILN